MGKHLVSGRVRLFVCITCLEASVFPVGKKGGSRQRLVWNGSGISAAAIKPPSPPFLAGPETIRWISLAEGRQLRVCKRDAKAWFDQLHLPRELWNYFAQPPITVSELVSHAGLSMEFIQQVIEEGTQLVANS